MEVTPPAENEATAITKAPAVKKIKIIVSDLHLGKGRLLQGGGLNSLEEFYYGEKLVEFIHFYSTGSYRDYEVELIVNGDFLNFLQCDYRGHFLSVITEGVSLEIMKEIVKGHQNVFKALAEFAAKPGNSITYIVGNHDQAMLWPACRAYLNQVIGTPVRYKNIVYFFDGVHIEHGHMHEAANRMDPKKFFLKKNLAEPILNLPFGSQFFVEVVLKIKHKVPHVDKIRPFGKMVRWALLNETKSMIASFFTAMGYFVRSALKTDPRRHWPLKRLIQVILESAIFPDLSESARKILNDERVHTVIFGHSHVYQYRQWSENKEYFNTGTWTELTSLDIVSLGKITKLTYVLIEYPEDGARPRGRLKEWKGYHRIEEDVAIS
ncbi:Calcineurin-like phosphoesterase superfamily domain protein [compost metagenome]